jgi:hypothetical protein
MDNAVCRYSAAVCRLHDSSYKIEEFGDSNVPCVAVHGTAV